MAKTNHYYIPGLIFCGLVILDDLIGIVTNSSFSIFSALSMVSILFAGIYCINSKKVFILFSYLLTISGHILSILNYRNFLINNEDFAYFAPAEIDELYFQNMLTTFISSILPLILLLLGVVIKKKGYSIFATISFSLIFITLTLMSIDTLYQTGSRFLISSTISSVLFNLYILVIWYKVGLSEFTKRKPIEMSNKPVVEKEILSVEISLESLKNSFDNGAINEEEYNRKKAEIIKSL